MISGEEMKQVSLILAVLALGGANIAKADTCPSPSEIAITSHDGATHYTAGQWGAEGKSSQQLDAFFRAGVQVDTADSSVGQVHLCAYKLKSGETLTLKPMVNAPRVKIASLNSNWSGSGSLKSCSAGVKACAFDVTSVNAQAK
jgi:hypothetical protein